MKTYRILYADCGHVSAVWLHAECPGEAVDKARTALGEDVQLLQVLGIEGPLMFPN